MEIQTDQYSGPFDHILCLSWYLNWKYLEVYYTFSENMKDLLSKDCNRLKLHLRFLDNCFQSWKSLPKNVFMALLCLAAGYALEAVPIRRRDMVGGGDQADRFWWIILSNEAWRSNDGERGFRVLGFWSRSHSACELACLGWAGWMS